MRRESDSTLLAEQNARISLEIIGHASAAGRARWTRPLLPRKLVLTGLLSRFAKTAPSGRFQGPRCVRWRRRRWQRPLRKQGRTEPDQPTRAYLKVIASNPEEVSRALAGGL